MPEEQDKDESLIYHLEALRSTLIKCFASIGILLPFAFFFAPKILKILTKIIIADTNLKLNYFSPMEVFIIQIKMSVLMSVILAFPYIAKNIWNFILPALYKHEKIFIKKIVFFSSTLFLAGVFFCIFLILPLIIRFGMSFAGENIQAVFGISNVINLAIGLSFTFGLMFQVPLLTHFLIKYEIISYDTINSKRPYVIVLLLIFAAILTPPDIISQLLLFLPTYLLFELGLMFSKKTHNNED